MFIINNQLNIILYNSCRQSQYNKNESYVIDLIFKLWLVAQINFVLIANFLMYIYTNLLFI